jgi:uncharacterized protein with WD repeat
VVLLSLLCTLQPTSKTFTLKVLYAGFSEPLSTFALTPTSEYHWFKASLTVSYFIISCHTTNYIVFALVSTFSMIWVQFMARENLKLRYFSGGLHISSTTNRITEQRSDTKENSSVTHFSHSSVFSACAISHSQFMSHYRTYRGMKLF